MERRTLVLTPHYSRHKVVSWQSAIVMVYKGTVDILAEYAETVSSPSVTMAIPAVLRLKKPTPSMMRAVRFSRENVIARDNCTCQYCGHKFSHLKLTIDHVIPKSRGGRKNWENAVAACKPCNSRKGRKTPHEAGMTLRRLPFKPKTLPIAAFRINVERLPEQWQPFCEDLPRETG